MRVTKVLQSSVFNVFISGMFVIWGFYQWHRTAVVFDDSYISYRYAANLVAGNGIVFNPGERVEGYTNFIWVLLAALGIRFHMDPFQFTRAIGILSYLLIVFSFSLPFPSCAQLPVRKRICFFFLAALMILPFGMAAMSGTGLETFFVSLLILLFGVTQHLVLLKGRLGQIMRNLIPVALCLTRPDSVLFLAASGLAHLIDFKSSGEDWITSCRKVLQRFAIPVLALAVYLLWKRWYYGGWVPNTYYAKAAYLWSLRAGITYVAAFLKNSPHVLILLPFAALAPFLSWKTPLRGLSLYSVFSLVSFILFMIKVGGDFMYYRMFFEIYPLFLLLAGLGLISVVATNLYAPLLCLLLGAAVSMVDPFLEERYYAMQSLEKMNSFVALGSAIGKRFQEVLPKNTIISTTLAGTIPYYSHLETLDQWGLNDAYIAHLPTQGIAYRGHVKFSPVDYLKERGVNLYIDHPFMCSCSQPSKEALSNVFIRIEGNQCLRTWYLIQKDELTRYFCQRPETFILNNIDCHVDQSP